MMAGFVINRAILLSMATKFTNDADDAEDLVQDTMMGAIRYDFTQVEKPGSLLYRIMQNAFNSRYRRKRNSPVETREQLNDSELCHLNVRNLAELKFLEEDIKEAMAGVPNGELIPFQMYVFGYRYEEIAEITAIPVGTVKTRIHMARKRMQQSLAIYRS